MLVITRHARKEKQEQRTSSQPRNKKKRKKERRPCGLCTKTMRDTSTRSGHSVHRVLAKDRREEDRGCNQGSRHTSKHASQLTIHPGPSDITNTHAPVYCTPPWLVPGPGASQSTGGVGRISARWPAASPASPASSPTPSSSSPHPPWLSPSPSSVSRSGSAAYAFIAAPK